MTRSTRELIDDAVTHLRILHRHLERGDLADETVSDAVSLRLAAAIESIQATGPDVYERLFGEDWALMWATRNRIAHGYAFIDLDRIRATVRQDLPRVEETLQAELARLRD